ncbi:hypothetical protein [Streptomyces sp. NPDC006879]|uniref:hypothetical protein n=1 Tax=Streptomyces sp. NPDC006879 TaxID=3364767 RepID=UPI00367FFF59
MRSENMQFIGGPLDGEVLSVLLGPTGHPPKVYVVPVPEPDGGAPVRHVYRRVPAGFSKRLRLPKGWVYTYDPQGAPRSGPKWPWNKPGPTSPAS